MQRWMADPLERAVVDKGVEDLLAYGHFLRVTAAAVKHSFSPAFMLQTYRGLAVGYWSPQSGSC